MHSQFSTEQPRGLMDMYSANLPATPPFTNPCSSPVMISRSAAVFSSARPLPVARERLAALAKHPAHGYALAKRDLRGTAHELFPSRNHEARLRELVPTWTAPEVKAKTEAVLAKRG